MNRLAAIFQLLFLWLSVQSAGAACADEPRLKRSLASWVLQSCAFSRTFTDARGQTIGYRHDAAGNLTELIYPGGIGSVHYTYDTHNRLKTVTDWANRTTTYHYSLTGQITRTDHANGTTRRHAWDAAGQLRGISELNSSGQPIYFTINRHDNAGRRDREIVSPAPQTYTPPAFAATYDDDNRLLTVNGQAVTVDDDGNLQGSAGVPPAFAGLTYNSRNQLLTAGNLSYKYDPLGNRIGVTDTTGETKWTIDPTASRALVREKPGGAKTYYIYGLGLLYEINGTATTTYHYDNRGNTIALTADNGTAILDRIEYSPYGTETWRQAAYDTPFRFCGAFGVQTDPNGLLNMRARYYSPYLMRFLNADPIGFSGGSNWFAYADGNPISLSDPFGLCAESGWSRAGQFAKDFGQGLLDYTWTDLGRDVGTTLAGAVEIINYPFEASGLDPMALGPFGGAEMGMVEGMASLGLLLRGASYADEVALAAKGGWVLPESGGGAAINGRWFTEHALERMAPNTPEVMATLESRALQRAQAAGLKTGTPEFKQWWAKNGPAPRGVPPSVVEAEIVNPGTTGVKVITNANGGVVTVITGQ